MTSHEILQSSLPDLLFEKRNKDYGAYALRKLYPKRLWMGVSISTASALLVFYLLGAEGSGVEVLPDDLPSVVTVTEFELPREVPPVQEQPAPQPAAASHTTAIDHTTIRIVPDDAAAVTEVPPAEDIAGAAISDHTTTGGPDTGRPVAKPGEGTGVQEGSVMPAEPVFDPVEMQPQFPGGAAAWSAFLNRHLQVPDELQAGEKRTVQVRFQVSAAGEVTQFEILQTGGYAFDREVIRVLKKMPKWKPAIQNGRPIAISFVQPVTFQAFEE